MIRPGTVQRVHDRRLDPEQRATGRSGDTGMVVHDVEVAHLQVGAKACGNASYQGFPSSCGSGGGDIGDTSCGLGSRATGREQGHVVARVDETVGEQRHDELDAAVSRWGNGEPDGCDDRDAHRREANAAAWSG